MIRRLFKDPDIEKRSSWDIDTIEEDFEMDSSNLWDTHVDTLKRRLNKFKKISETKNTGGRSSSIRPRSLEAPVPVTFDPRGRGGEGVYKYK